MKRAKIMLTAITVLAVVGGALAFKARNFETLFITSPAHPNSCTSSTTIYTETTATPSIDLKASTTNGGTCTTFHVTTTEN